MAQEAPNDIIKRYLVDAVAAEKSFESQLRSMSNEGDQPEVQQLFAQHADETRLQWERLEARLNALGGTESKWKSLVAHFFGVTPKTAQLGHDPAEKSTQDLMIAYAVESGEVAMYEAMIAAADTVGDDVTARLARDIQDEEKRTANRVLSLISPSSRGAVRKLIAESVS